MNIKVFALAALLTIEPAFENVNDPVLVVDSVSALAPVAVTVKSRSVDALDIFEYCRLPPLNTRLFAAFEDWPILLATPPSARVDATKLPWLTVVTPV